MLIQHIFKAGGVIALPSALTKSSGARTCPRTASQARKSAAVSFQRGRQLPCGPCPGREGSVFAARKGSSASRRPAPTRAMLPRSTDAASPGRASPSGSRDSGAFKDRPHLLHRQVRDELLIVALCRYGGDPRPICLLQGCWQLILEVAHECLDGRQAEIARDRTVSSFALDIFEKVEDQRGVELLDVQLRRGCSYALGGKGKQQPEAVGVGLAGVRAVAALAGAYNRARSQ